MAKKLSEVELCRLLGFCGLGWHEQHLLLPIWANIKKQPDRASREAVLSAFFADLARLDPSLQFYSNQAFFDDIVNHCFIPGDDYDTCHKGFSPLAFMQRTHAEVTEDNANADHYTEVSIRTVSDVKKHRTKGPPPIPNNVAELLRLNKRDVTVLKAFFTEWSSLVQQETDLNDGLHDLQTDLFSRLDSTRQMIPQLMRQRNCIQSSSPASLKSRTAIPCPHGRGTETAAIDRQRSTKRQGFCRCIVYRGRVSARASVESAFAKT
jgi:hypothetical protein